MKLLKDWQKEIKLWWEMKDLAHPLVILRRAVSYPIVFIGATIHAIGVWLAFGWDEAKVDFMENI